MARQGLARNYRRQLLADSELFGVLSEAQIEDLLDRSAIQRAAAGEEIVHEGDPSTHFYVLLAGRVAVSMRSPDGRDMVIRLIEPGENFGEIAVLDGQPRTASARAQVACELISMSRSEFEGYIKRTPEIALRLLQRMAQQLRVTSEILKDNVFLPLPQRLAKMLVSLANRYGEPTDDGMRIDLSLSQRLAAEMVGSTRESVNAQMLEWDKAGLLLRSRGSITIRDLAGLERIATGSD